MTFLYSYFNKKAGAYMDPIPSPIPQEGWANSVIRTCKLEPEACKKAHLDECDLYILGEFDDIKGDLKAYEKPIFIVSLDQYFVKEEVKQDDSKA